MERSRGCIWGSVGGFRTHHHVNLHDLEIPNMLLRPLEPKIELESLVGDGFAAYVESTKFKSNFEFRIWIPNVHIII